MEIKKDCPQLRFPEFKNNWEIKKLEEVCEIKTGGKDTQDKSDEGLYPFFVRSNTVERINSFSYDGEAILTSGDGVGVGKNFHYINGKFDFHQRVYCLRDFKKEFLGKYIYFVFSEQFYNRVIKLSAKNSVDSVRLDMIAKMRIFFPSLPEQQKIATFLSSVDTKINQLKQKKTLLEQYKKGVMQQIFAQEIRFKDENGNDFPEWEEMPLGDCLNYEQPTNYLVTSTEYDDKYDVPVLTAGKTFILGYTNETHGVFKSILPVIIFDDFTTATQFVNFPFKAKSSAMKILLPKENVNIKFIYDAMQMVKYEIGGHERHWISKYSKIEIFTPCLTEQTKIANFLSAIDDKIVHCNSQIEKMEVWKKGLLQKMFV